MFNEEGRQNLAQAVKFWGARQDRAIDKVRKYFICFDRTLCYGTCNRETVGS